ncbi:MAG: multicopper oxidase domain-containing protein [Thermoflavifilum aggregans]|nr:multicopper oxidase domain-containing protein [Thermoflavifilum aggregans]
MKFMNIKNIFRIIVGVLTWIILQNIPTQACAQTHPVREYWLTIREQKVNKAGKWIKAVTVNDSIPAPTLYFTEGDLAVIHITNAMEEPSSIHWHGILLPNYYDGVPYLSTPPIAPGKTFTVRFVIRQHGTYWYHSHSMMQEQRGLYGAIVIYPRKQAPHEYDKEKTILLSDWTNESPHRIMNNLKRGLEWYTIKKGQAQSLDRVIAHHGLGERIQMAWQRMPPMDISDVYYDAFLANGQRALYFPDAKPGDRIRVRIINGSSSTFFHLQYSGGNMQIIAADGQDVKPVEITRMLIGIAETYDVILTIPGNGQYELRTTAQDGSGWASVYFGKGSLHPAPTLPKPDIFHMEAVMMEGMAGMKMKMDHMNMYVSQKRMEREMPYIRKDYLSREDIRIGGALSMQMPGMHMHDMHMHDMDNMEMHDMDMHDMDMHDMDMHDMEMHDTEMDASQGEQPHQTHTGEMPANTMSDNHDMHHMHMLHMEMQDDSPSANEKNMQADSIIFNYDMLQALHSTAFDTTQHPVRHLTFNLTGSMWRYNWSINGKTLSEEDSIQVKQGEILRITLNNETMMYHPMHLHGHFFRVINANGSYSPLKHTVIVPPMRSITIEFAANEPGDWFFHCHILYHMMAGMARTFQYTDYIQPDTMQYFPIKHLLHDDNHWFFWGNAMLASNYGEGYLSYSNRKNWIQVNGEYGWHHQQYEWQSTYERFITRYLRPYAGVVTSNKEEYLNYFKNNGKPIPSQDTRGIIGVRYLLPLFLNADLRMDTRAHVRFTLSGETWLFPRIWLNYSVNTDKEWYVQAEGMINANISLTAGYHSDYAWGGGLLFRF